MLHPRGLVPKLLGLRSQLRGDWSQRIMVASITSESDSNTFAGEEMQRHLLYYFFSLTTDMNPFSPIPQVPAAKPGRRNNTNIAGVRVHYFFASGCLSIPFRLQSMATLNLGNPWQMWEFICI